MRHAFFPGVVEDGVDMQGTDGVEAVREDSARHVNDGFVLPDVEGVVCVEDLDCLRVALGRGTGALAWEDSLV